MQLFVRRQELSRDIGAYKAACGLPVQDPEREAQVLRSRGDLAPERREQVERARAALERGGVPQSFAPLLAGGDDGDTDRRTEEFRAAYQASLAEDVKSRLPASAPVVTAPLPQRPRRGIRRLR